MNVQERWEKHKPSIMGFVLGLIIAPILMFSFGWVVSSSEKSEAVSEATVEAWSAACLDRSLERASETNRAPSSFEGWDNRESRESFVSNIVAGMTIPESYRSDVSNSCSRALGYPEEDSSA